MLIKAETFSALHSSVPKHCQGVTGVDINDISHLVFMKSTQKISMSRRVFYQTLGKLFLAFASMWLFKKEKAEKNESVFFLICPRERGGERENC